MHDISKCLSTLVNPELSEACPKMTRRFRSEPVLEITTWLLIHRTRAALQLAELKRPRDPEMRTWHEGMTRVLQSRIAALDNLINAVPDRFPQVEWSAAAATVSSWVTENATTPLAQELNPPPGPETLE